MALHDMLWLLACGTMLIIAVWSDLKTMRIPNWCVLSGAISALIVSNLTGGIGLAQAAGGCAAGLALLMPLYVLRVLGAGDVKLLAALGAFTGYPGVFGLILATLIAGGVISLLWAVRYEKLGAVAANIRTGMIHGLMDATSGKLPNAQNFPTSQSRVPYACAIAVGWVSYVILSDKFELAQISHLL